MANDTGGKTAFSFPLTRIIFKFALGRVFPGG